MFEKIAGGPLVLAEKDILKLRNDQNHHQKDNDEPSIKPFKNSDGLASSIQLLATDAA